MKFSTVLPALTLLVGAGAIAALPVPSAHAMVAPADGAKVLKEVDRRAAPFKDQAYTATMEIIRGGQVKKTLKFKARMKGLDRQLLEFTNPGDVMGMKVLLSGSDKLWVYLPEYKKVRMVAAHARKQAFFGSTFNFADMVEVLLSSYYDAEIAGREGSETKLVLTPKTGVKASYPKLEVFIDGKKGGVTKILYLDESGAKVREQQRSEWIKIEGHLMPTKVTMMDYKTGDLTVIMLSDVVVNQGFDDAEFSRRALLR